MIISVDKGSAFYWTNIVNPCCNIPRNLFKTSLGLMIKDTMLRQEKKRKKGSIIGPTIRSYNRVTSAD